MQPCIYSVQQRRKARGPQANSLHFNVQPSYISPLASTVVAEPIPLGVLDSLFVQDSRRPTLVELLVLVPSALDASRVGEATQQALSDLNGGFASVGGVQQAKPASGGGNPSIFPGPGVRFSACSIDDTQLLSRPPPPSLFDNPTEEMKSNNDCDDKSSSSSSSTIGSSSSSSSTSSSSSIKAEAIERSDSHRVGVLTLRVSHGRSEQLTGLGLTFDHALCDVSGVALFLAHVSARYVALSRQGSNVAALADELPAPPPSLPPPPVHNRALQSIIVQKSISPAGEEERAAATAALVSPGSASAVKKASARIGGLKGGCGCVEWRYRASDLAALKASYQAHSRHDAAFADVISLLRAAYVSEAKAATVEMESANEDAGCSPSHNMSCNKSGDKEQPRPLNSATISRDERLRCGLPAELFGNGISLVQATLPPDLSYAETVNGDGATQGDGSCAASPAARAEAASAKVNTAEFEEGNGDEREAQLGCVAIARALREAITHGAGLPPDWPHYADVHLNTWWHPLQHRSARIAPKEDAPTSSSGYWFGAPSPPSFAVGPGSIAAAASMCQARGGQPNITLLPWPEADDVENKGGGGFVVSLIAPLRTSHAVLKLLQAREKKAKQQRKSKLREVALASAPPTSNLLQGSGAEATPISLAGHSAPIASVKVTAKTGAPAESTDAPPSTSAGRITDTAHEPTCAVVWLHGLGDASQSWGKRLSAAHPGLATMLQEEKSGSAATTCVFMQPLAPLISVEAMNGASCHAWFDLPQLPVASTDLNATSESQLQVAVSLVHGELDTLQRRGIAPERIILGGFSQGAAVALAAGLSYSHRLAGLISVSGWWPHLHSSKDDSSTHSSNSSSNSENCQGILQNGPKVPVPPWVNSALDLPAEDDHNGEYASADKDDAPATQMPIYFSYGTSDNTVASRLSQSSAHYLQQCLCPGGDDKSKKCNTKQKKSSTDISALNTSAEQSTKLSRFSVVVEAVQRKKHPPNQAETQKVASSIFAMLGSDSGTPSATSTPAVSVETAAAGTASSDSSRSTDARPFVAPLAGGWSCHGSSNDELVDKLVAAKILTSPLATDAMRRTDRQVYCTVKGWVRDPPTRKSVQASDAGSTNDNTQSGGGGGSELQSQQSSGVARQGKSSAYAYGPYADAPQAIGFKATISAPHVHAKALDLLASHLAMPGCRALDIGCGSGVLVACMARLANAAQDAVQRASSSSSALPDLGDSAAPMSFSEELSLKEKRTKRNLVVGIDRVPELVALSAENLQRDGFHVEMDDESSSSSGDVRHDRGGGGGDGNNGSGEGVDSSDCCRVVVRVGDGWNTSDANEKPENERPEIGEEELFDAIHVGAAPPHLPPALLQRLKPGGRMVVPVGPPRGTWQEWRCVDRATTEAVANGAEEFSSRVISSVRFVPLKFGIGPN